ncbi:CoA transferase [SAR202 cluster bacterium AD-804-J14_MRT_500m]|nr:CoA transferase [SAR202 cluster bacterium AD-804-J14_MRT_500m]
MISSNNSQIAQPLSGYQVLDLSGPIGVYCGKLMADMGARVIKIEPPGGDPMRKIGPFINDEAHPERSLYWLHFNTNKESITLDLSSKRGAELYRRLATNSDLVLETFHPNFMDSLDLSYTALSKHNPDLIYLSVTPFGRTGPYKDYKGSDLVGLAMGGYLYVTGWPHTPPTRLWGEQAYHATSNRAFIAALLAIYQRQTTGFGQSIDVSMQESVAATTEHVGLTYLYQGASATRCGFKHAGRFVATWKCKDGYVSITTPNRRAWDDLREWMSNDGMVEDLMDPTYDDVFLVREQHSEHIENIVSRWALIHTRDEITKWGQSRHHPFGPASLPHELINNPQLLDRGFFHTSELQGLGVSATHPGAPYHLTLSPWQLKRSSPTIGQHNDSIYKKDLGLKDSDLDSLHASGVI